MRSVFRAFGRDDDGATSIEYAFIASLIAMVIVGALTAIGTNLNLPFVTVSGSLQ